MPGSFIEDPNGPWLCHGKPGAPQSCLPPFVAAVPWGHIPPPLTSLSAGYATMLNHLANSVVLFKVQLGYLLQEAIFGLHFFDLPTYYCQAGPPAP